MFGENQRKFRNLDGDEITVTYAVLSHKEAMEIEYESLGLITGAVSEAFGHLMGLFAELPTSTFAKDGEEELNISDVRSTEYVAKAISAIHRSVGFDRLWDVAKSVLRSAVIETSDNRAAKIDDLERCNFFTDRMDELLLAVFWGLDVSFPRAFSKARSFLSRFKAPGGTEEESQTLQKGSSGPSPERKRISL